MNCIVTDFPALEWERWEKETFEGRVKTGNCVNQKIRLLEFPNFFCEKKWCITPYQGILLRGKMAIEFENNTIICEEGMGFVVPPGKHRLKSLNNKKVLLFVITKCDGLVKS